MSIEELHFSISSAAALEREDATIAAFEDNWRDWAMASARHLTHTYA
jgi:hypothetical protein